MIRGLTFVTLGVRLILLLAVIAVATMVFVVSSNSGLQQLLIQGQRWIPGALEVERVEGTLLDKLTLYGVDYRHQDLHISLARIHLAWSPTALFGGTLHIEAVDLLQPEITLPAAEAAPEVDDTPLFPIRLPELVFPIQLRVDSLSVQQFLLQQPAVSGEVPAPVQIDTLTLRAYTENKTLMLEQLQIGAPQGQLTLQGQLLPSDTFRLQLKTDWSLALPGYSALQGQGRISGSLADLAVEQQLSGLLNATVSATLQALLESPQGSVRVEKLRADLGLALPELKGQMLRGDLSASGNLQGVELSGQWQAHLPEWGDSLLQADLQLSRDRLQLQRLRVTQEATGAELQFSGVIDQLQQLPQLALQGHWQNLGYPLQGGALVSSPKGQIQIEGSLKNYQLQLDTALSGPDIPAGQWQLQAQGNEQGLSPFTLTAETLGGQLQAEGQLSWLPQVSWQLGLTTQRLNPGVHWPEWPASLDMSARVVGVINANQPLQLTAELQRLSGTLRDQAVDGRAHLELQGSELRIEQLRLLLAGAELQAEGVLGEQLNVDWSLQAPDLKKLLPNAGGHLSATGALRGPTQQLQLQAELQGRELQFDAQRIASLDADIDVDLSAQKASSVELQASELDLGGQRWQQLSLQGQGTPAQHQLRVDLDQGPIELKLALGGRWLGSSWSGAISQLDLQQELAGPWRLQHPASLQASATSANIEPFCLQRVPLGSGELCGNGRWSNQKGINGALQTRQLGLKLLEPWLPVGTDVKGQLQARADFGLKPGQRPRFQIDAELLDSELLLEDADLRVEAGEIRLTLNGRGEQLRAELQLPLRQPAGSLQATLAVKDLYRRPGLDGQLDMAINDLKFISLFTPQLQAISGKLESVLTLSGSVEQPQVQGYLQLSNAHAEVPALGIKLDEIELALRDQPNSDALQLTGSVRSGEGALQLNGLFLPLTQSGQVALKGQRFKAVDTREVKAWISPDISAEFTPQALTIRGEVQIPEAKVTPPPLTFSAALSEDVVIVDSRAGAVNGAAKSRQTLDAQVRISLGDKVEVDALGFKGLLQGSILVEDDARRATRATGSLLVAAGKYRLYGQDLNIERGSLVFSGGPVDNPGLDLRVSRKVDQVTAGARVGGTLRTPRLTLFSEPAMPESSLLSYLLLGRAPGTETSTPSEQELMLKAAIALATMGGNAVAENLAETFSIDELGFESAGASNNTSLYIGKYLSPRLYAKYGIGLLEPSNTFFLRYRLNKRWSIESETSTTSNSGDLIYTLER